VGNWINEWATVEKKQQQMAVSSEELGTQDIKSC
jgi:hypothetical protein